MLHGIISAPYGNAIQSDSCLSYLGTSLVAHCIQTLFCNFVLDETVDSWFLMSSPGPVFTIVAAYLVLVLKIGPTFMKNRKAYNLKNVMIAYNAFQVCYSIWMCRTVMYSPAVILHVFLITIYYSYLIPKSLQESRITDTLMSKKCEIVRTRAQSLNLYSGAWFYFFSKIIDLLDTCFFVLRKKQNQVTFLHVYHHTITALFSWMYLKYAPGILKENICIYHFNFMLTILF